MQNLNLIYPQFLYLFLLIPLIVWSWWDGRIPLGRFRSVVSLILRLVIFSLIILALTGIEIKKKSEGLTVFYCIDRSLSIPPNNFKSTSDFIKKSTDGMSRDDRLGIILYGKDAMIELPALQKSEFSFLDYESKPDQNETNILNALELALAALPPGNAGKVVLITDGQETTGHAQDIIGRYKMQEVPIDVIPLSSFTKEEIAITGFRAPWKVAEGQPFQMSLIISSPKEEAQVPLSIYDGERLLREERVDLKPGKNRFKFTFHEQVAGIHTFRAQIMPQNDPIAENNQALAPVQIKAKPRILLLDDTGGKEFLSDILKDMDKFELNVQPGSACPLSLLELENYDLIILNNVEAPSLGESRMNALKTYVEELGGGLLMIGGSQSFGVGGYYKTAIEEVLPVRMDVEKRGIYPSSALIIAIDKSGSMDMTENGIEKIQLAKEAAILTADLLGRNDYIGVVAFDSDAKWVVRPMLASNMEKIREEIASLRAGGGTSMYPALEEAYKELSTIKAFKKHIIALTDGQTSQADFENLTKTITDNKITISTVGIGKDADVRFLEDLAKWGKGKFYFTRDVQALPQIFTQDAMRAVGHSVIEEPFKPQVGSISEIIKGIDWQAAPSLLGYNATTLKASKLAQAPLITHKGDPLFAIWSYGIGRSGAFTSDVQPRWGKNWVSWSQSGGFFKQVSRSLARSGGSDNAEIKVTEQEGGGLGIQAQVFDEKGESNFLNTKVSIISPDGKIERLNMKQESLGQYISSLPPLSKGTYLFKVVGRDSTGRLTVNETMAYAVPYSAEFASQPIPSGFLSLLSRETGGTYKIKEDEVFRKRPNIMIARPIWHILLLLALLLFPLDVGIRRIMIGSEVWNKVWVYIKGFIVFNRRHYKDKVEIEGSLKRLLDTKKQIQPEVEDILPKHIPFTYQPAIKPRVQKEIKEEADIQGIKPQEKKVEEPQEKEEASTLFTKRLLEAKKKKKEE